MALILVKTQYNKLKNYSMKKLVLAIIFFGGLTAAQAQQTTPKEKDEVKKTTTIPQEIHNIVDPKHPEHSGYKVKKKTRKGNKYVKRVNTENKTATIKTKKAGEMEKNVKTVPIK
ncbi:hypothetical protein NBC122_02889 [Chryseobacterium salivictor]|uniref:Uncharacterized protein n=2 Tax=Chryseobacterium salivictor TaxID=2547600 RepID=A0A4P6ZIX3_9FLAO|nr:hypothetical protein NBC122_02889 [Chryseobacterium salivictor]